MLISAYLTPLQGQVDAGNSVPSFESCEAITYVDAGSSVRVFWKLRSYHLRGM